MNAPLRVVYMGTPDFAVPSLHALAADPRCEVTLVVSQPDRPAGRGKKARPTPVAAAADELGIERYQPDRLRGDACVARLRDERPDLVVVAAYGQILREDVLTVPRLGCVNVHASLLPRWRGAAPIQWAVAEGDGATGVSIMAMERGLDTGPVYAMAATMIGETETAGELHDRLAELGASLLIDTLDAIASGSRPTPQASSRATYARMLRHEDRVLDFGRPAAEVAHRINGMSPWPGTRVACGDEILALRRARPSDVTVPDDIVPGSVCVADGTSGLHIVCGDGRAIEVLELQRPGKRAMDARTCLLGMSLATGLALEPTT